MRHATPGAVAALTLGRGPVGAVALAGVTWISSSGVIAKVMTDLGRLGNRETPVILGVLVMEDLAMAVYLPLLTAMLAGVSLAGGSLALVIACSATPCRSAPRAPAEVRRRSAGCTRRPCAAWTC
ncbi:hypothetical protein SCYAM73S_05397 [Streptomyces cyaneofuscatus]